jgi:hypothetical protein
VARRHQGALALALILAGCFIDNGGGATAGEADTTAADTTAADTAADTTAATAAPVTDPACTDACTTTTTTTETPTTTTDATTTAATTADTTTGAPSVNLLLATQVDANGAFALAVTNFDGDANNDLAITSRDLDAPNLYIMLGASLGGLQVFDAGAWTGLVAADLDDDGISELVLAQPSPASVQLIAWLAPGLDYGPGYDLPCEVPLGLTLGDIDANTLLDVVVGCESGSGIHFFLGNGDAAFAPPMQLEFPGEATSLVLADMLGDAAPELVIADLTANTVHVVPTAPSMAALEFVVDSPTMVAVGDVDDDGVADIAVASAVGACTLLRGSPDKTVVEAPYACGDDARDVRVADLDGDGLGDLVTAHGDGLHLGLGLGDGQFTAPQVFPTRQPASRLGVGDFDGDNRGDVALTVQDGVVVFLQTG